jgi:4-alpha-glucanotransferase
VYTGTHDNDTIRGWFQSLSKTKSQERGHVLRYTGTPGKEIHWDLIRLASMSVASVSLFPLQDVLGLGSEARMNVPGTSTGNWQWRVRAGALTPRVADHLHELTHTYARTCGERGGDPEAFVRRRRR